MQALDKEGRDDLCCTVPDRGPKPLASVCGRVCGVPCETACRRDVLIQGPDQTFVRTHRIDHAALIATIPELTVY